MRWRTWLAAASGMAAGYVGYQWLQRVLERKIRRELIAPLLPGGDAPPKGGALPALQVGETLATEAGKSLELRVQAEDSSMEDLILAAVRRRPGVRQTELYALFPQESRRNLQDLLLRMERGSVLQRQRDRSTYRLYAEETNR